MLPYMLFTLIEIKIHLELKGSWMNVTLKTVIDINKIFLTGVPSTHTLLKLTSLFLGHEKCQKSQFAMVGKFTTTSVKDEML